MHASDPYLWRISMRTCSDISWRNWTPRAHARFAEHAVNWLPLYRGDLKSAIHHQLRVEVEQCRHNNWGNKLFDECCRFESSQRDPLDSLQSVVNLIGHLEERLLTAAGSARITPGALFQVQMRHLHYSGKGQDIDIPNESTLSSPQCRTTDSTARSESDSRIQILDQARLIPTVAFFSAFA